MLLFEWVYILWLTEGFCWASLLLLDNIKDCKFIHVSRSDNWLLWSMMTFEQPKHSFHGSSVNVTSKHTHTHTRVSKPLFMVEKKDGVESQALITPSSDLYTCEPWPHYNPETKTFLMLWKALFIKHSWQYKNLPGFINATGQVCVFSSKAMTLRTSILTGLKLFVILQLRVDNEQLVLYTYT